MTATFDFDRLLGSVLEAGGPQTVPSSLVEVALTKARALPQRRPLVPALDRRVWPARHLWPPRPATARLAVLGLIILLTLALIATAIGIGSRLLRADVPSNAYEAVVLRTEVVDGSQVVIVVGVNAGGHERPIATLPDAWVHESAVGSLGRYLPPMGAVSPSGLLAIPSGGSDLMMHWEIFDLHRPQAEPIVVSGMDQFIEQLRATPYWKVDTRGGVFWGPGERLANLWYPPGGGEVKLRLSVIDGRTGNATAVAMAAGVVLPYWASDGSGVLVGNSSTDVTPRRVLRLDGTVVDAPAAPAQSSCRPPSGFEFACLAPDDSMIADIDGGTTASGRGVRLIAQGSGASFEIHGSFAGWLEVDR